MLSSIERTYEIRPLLTQLAVGVDTPLYSPSAWTEYLDSNVTSEWFLKQMRKEWQAVTAPDELCAAIQREVYDHLITRAGGAHMWAHTLRVTGMSTAIAAEAGIAPNEAFLLGVLHDIGKLDQDAEGDTHEVIGAKLARLKLRDRLPRETIEVLALAIAKQAKSSNPYAKLLSDADKLDKIGATGIARRISSYPLEEAMRRVRTDLVTFRPMNFPFSQNMADLKKMFTIQALSVIDAAM